MRPLTAGCLYGAVAALIALAVNFYFLLLNPAETSGWVIAVIIANFPTLALASYVFLAVLAALAARPVRLDPGVSYSALLLRDGALAATVVALMVGAVGFFATALQATAFADEMRVYAREAAPLAASYTNEQRREIREGREDRGAPRGDLPPPSNAEDLRRNLSPPHLSELGISIASTVVLAVLLGTVGAITGAVRGRLGGYSEDDGSSSEPRSVGGA